MSLIVWGKQYSVNVPQMDHQHQHLVNMINELHDAMETGRGKNAVGPIINRMITYTQSHFRDEERFLQSIGFRDLPRQMQEHKVFVAKVTEFKKSFDSGAASLTPKVLGFLQSWLMDHIQHSDAEYGKQCTTETARV